MEVSSGADLASISDEMFMLVQNVNAALPVPPIDAAARLYCGPAADRVDRISHLPVSIVRNIVSRLPPKDAMSISLLSDRWYRVWKQVPIVLVDAHLLPSSGRTDAGVLAAAVSGALESLPGPFELVHLTAIPMADYPEKIKRWLDLLVDKGVDKLVFLNRAKNTKDMELELPPTIFRCSFLTVLYLGSWSVRAATALPPGTTALPCLRELGLCSISIKSRALEKLLRICPALEKLIIVSNMSVMLRLRISHRTLRCLEISTSWVPVIHLLNCPCLERFLFWHPFIREASPDPVDDYMTIRIGHAPRLDTVGFLMPGQQNLRITHTQTKGRKDFVPTVLMLAIQVKLGTCIEAMMLPYLLRCFPNVKTLYIQSEIDDDEPHSKLSPMFWEDAAPLEHIQQQLTRLVFREFQGQRSEVDFLKFIVKQAPVLESMEVYLTPGSSSQVAATNLRNAMASSQWANDCCRLDIYSSTFPDEGNPWCYARASCLSIRDPFDITKCPAGNCLEDSIVPVDRPAGNCLEDSIVPVDLVCV